MNQDTRKKLAEMENKRKNSGEEAERLRNALQEAQVTFSHKVTCLIKRTATNKLLTRGLGKTKLGLLAWDILLAQAC